MKRLLSLIIIVCGLVGCDTVTISNDRLLNLYRQRIPNSKYVMYEFNVAGHMAFDGNDQSYAILDSSQVFSGDKINEIDAYYVQGRLILDSLHMVYLYSPGDRATSENDTLMAPTKEYTKTYNGIPIKVSEYLNTYGVPVNWTPGGNDYTFENLKETEDSLIFYEIEKMDGYGVNIPVTKSFIKGNINLIDSSNGQIDHIEIKELVIRREEVYMLGGRDSILQNRPVVDMIEYDLFPKKPKSASILSDFGIYKRLK